MIRRGVVLTRRRLRRSRAAQVLLLVAVWWLAEQVVTRLRLPLTGGLLGMALVLAALALGRLSPRTIERGAAFLLDEMLLFFVPATLVVLDHPRLLGLLGLKLLLVIVVGTVTVMGGTALAVDACYRWSLRRGR